MVQIYKKIILIFTLVQSFVLFIFICFELRGQDKDTLVYISMT